LSTQQSIRAALALLANWPRGANFSDETTLEEALADGHIQALFDIDALRDYLYVSTHVKSAVRTADLFWSHHRLVAEVLNIFMPPSIKMNIRNGKSLA
jgi:hypothetical protein